MKRRYLVEGRVQGVGFRFFVRQGGRGLGVTGWVRNTPEGGVEVLASGTEAQLLSLEAMLRNGPPAAHVTSLQVTDSSDELDALTAFEIRG